jgi:hypothetical protein
MDSNNKILTKEKLEKIVSEALFNQEDTSMKISLSTGKGGVKEFIKAWCKEIGIEYNWRNLRRQYSAMIHAGWIIKYPGGGYQIK